MYMNKFVTAVIVAAGKGTRMGSDKPKQYIIIDGKTILETTLYKFEKNNYIDEIILIVNKEDLEFVISYISCDCAKIKKVLQGGDNRTESVYQGIKNADKNCEILLIHDGVRPFVSNDLINKSVETANQHGACIPILPVTDTIKRVRDGYVQETVERKMLGAVQTPQAFDYKLIRQCYGKAMVAEENFTDDASIVEYYGYKVKTIEGLQENIKITTPFDLKIAEILSNACI